MQPGAGLLFTPFDGQNWLFKASELGEFLLDCLQTFMPLAVSNLSLRFISAPIFRKPILFAQLLNVCDLVAETPYLFAKDFEVIHVYQNSASRRINGLRSVSTDRTAGVSASYAVFFPAFTFAHRARWAAAIRAR